ncbi:hypothetical protein [Thermosulfurimonas sp. F29]|uniref:hypothetical protein n=1 Tax=Thermosulfurimonas sp. F29 TaxID=2867247 RepID=UPI001C83CA7E|nr:hypothetical protein [Thermosulfurimonas sp. F29]MBX6423800.1 hypothetical protein [Thermosulfurimonas sp. F29]
MKAKAKTKTLLLALVLFLFAFAVVGTARAMDADEGDKYFLGMMDKVKKEEVPNVVRAMMPPKKVLDRLAKYYAPEFGVSVSDAKEAFRSSVTTEARKLVYCLKRFYKFGKIRPMTEDEAKKFEGMKQYEAAERGITVVYDNDFYNDQDLQIAGVDKAKQCAYWLYKDGKTGTVFIPRMCEVDGKMFLTGLTVFARGVKTRDMFGSPAARVPMQILQCYSIQDNGPGVGLMF